MAHYDVEYDDYWHGYDPDGVDPSKLLNKLIGWQKMIRATIQDTRINLEGQIEYNQSLIEQTATDILLQVTQIKEATDGRLDYAEAQININANEISSRVTYTDYNGNQIASRINQTATNILIQASKIDFVGVSSFHLGDGYLGSTKIMGGIINATQLQIEQSSYLLDLRASGIFFATGSSSPPSITRIGNSLDIYAPSNIELNGNVLVNGYPIPTQFGGTAYDAARLGGFPANTYSRTNHNHGNTYVKAQNSQDISIAVTSDGIVVRQNGSVMGSLLW